MFKKQKKQLQEEEQRKLTNNEDNQLLRKKTIKELIAPSGIDASKMDHLEIISSVKRSSFFNSSSFFIIIPLFIFTSG